jgi:hypothetical protein
MADELYESLNELLPVASVVHIALGLMALVLVHRTDDREWNERLAGLLISWMMVILGIQYVFSTLIDYRVEQLGNNEVSVFNTYESIFYSWMTYGQSALESAFYASIAVLPLIYPYPLIQKKDVLKVCTVFILVAAMILVPLDIFTEFSYRGVKYMFVWTGYIVWTPVYLRFLFGELLDGEEEARAISSVTALLMLGVFGQSYIFWLQNITGISSVYYGRWVVEDFVAQTFLSSSVSMVQLALTGTTFLVIFIGESWRAMSKGFGGLNIVVSLVFVVGVLWYLLTLVNYDAAESCVLTACEAWDENFVDWYVFTYQVAKFLGVPLIFMFVLLNYNMVDTAAEGSKMITRIMVLLLLLVATSSIIEMIQIILPIPEMITSALFAGGVVVFIGWEERIMDQIITETSSAAESVKELIGIANISIPDGEYRFFSMGMAVMVCYALLIAILFDSMGIHK